MNKSNNLAQIGTTSIDYSLPLCSIQRQQIISLQSYYLSQLNCYKIIQVNKQITMAYRSKSAQLRPNTLLSIETGSFLKTNQILEHQQFIPFLKRQSPEINQIPSQRQCFTLKHIANPPQDIPQDRPLNKTNTAIHELEELMTPKGQDLTSFARIVDNVKMTQSIQHKQAPLYLDQLHIPSRQKSSYADCELKNIDKYHKQKESLRKVNALLLKQQAKQREFQDNIMYLQEKIKKIKEEKNQTQFLFRKLQHQHSKLEQRYKEVEDKLKKRVIVNLELEALMVSINIKNNSKLNELINTITNLENALHEKDKDYSSKIKKLKEQYQKSKKVGQQQISALITELSKRSNELSELKTKQKTSIFDSQPIFDKFGVSTKNSNYFMEIPFLKNEQRQSGKNNGFKPITTNSLVPQHPEITQLVEGSPEVKLKLQNLTLQNFSFGKNRPICISERI